MKKLRIFKTALAVSDLALIVSGCSTATVMPLANDQFQAVAAVSLVRAITCIK
jgi:hypothetical protein